MVVTLGQQYNTEEKPIVMLYTYTLITMQEHQTNTKQN